MKIVSVISLTQFQIDIINRKLEKPNRNKKDATNTQRTHTHTYKNGLDCINKMWQAKQAICVMCVYVLKQAHKIMLEREKYESYVCD